MNIMMIYNLHTPYHFLNQWKGHSDKRLLQTISSTGGKAKRDDSFCSKNIMFFEMMKNESLILKEIQEMNTSRRNEKD